MERFDLVLIGLFFKILPVTAQAPVLDWATQVGEVNSEAPSGITTDPSGNVYKIGFFQGTVDFDPGPGTLNLSSAGMNDLYVQKLDPNGDLIWEKTFGGPGFDYIKGIELDPSGNVIVAGAFDLTCDFDPGPCTYNLTSS